MTFYGQKNYADKMGGGNGGLPAKYTIAQTGCFLTAFCNLLNRFGKPIDPPSLNKIFTQRGIYIDVDDGVKDDLGWPSVTAYDGQVHVTSTGGAGWPPSSNAIVKFAYTSPKTGDHTTHFCLVADPTKQLIVDSWDGVIRTPGYYGNPVAWATYDNVVPEAVVVSAQVPIPQQVSSATTGATYTFQKGDTVWSVAGRFGFTAAELIALNGISDVRTLPVGYVIHLPVKTPPPVQQSGYKIEILNEPKIMHVSKAGGAEKWAFGNVRQWSDFTSTGHVAENTNVQVAAVAKVQIGTETAAYYMDALAVGNYNTTGAVANTIGFNWSDLAEGPYIAPLIPETPEPAPEPVVETVLDITNKDPDHAIPTPAAQPDESQPNFYKTTYKAFPKPVTYIANETMMCKEYDGRRADHQLVKGKAVSISGTFIYGQDVLGRPTDVVELGLYYGVPMDKLTREDTLFNDKVDLATKAAMRHSLTLAERVAVGIAWGVSQLTKIQTALTTKGTKE